MGSVYWDPFHSVMFSQGSSQARGSAVVRSRDLLFARTVRLHSLLALTLIQGALILTSIT
jgi:hypothetical protein